MLVGTSGCGASPRTVTVQGTTAWGGYEKVSSDTPRQLEVHGYASNQPVDDAPQLPLTGHSTGDSSGRLGTRSSPDDVPRSRRVAHG